MAGMADRLPIDDVLPDLTAALAAGPNAVLAAPPGAGKTTRVPLALLGADWLGDAKILMLEPRRIAARAAAERLATQLGEQVGQSVGYRIRGWLPGACLRVRSDGCCEIHARARWSTGTRKDILGCGPRSRGCWRIREGCRSMRATC